MIHFKKITLNQLICLVILTQVGVSVLSIPFEESRNSGYDAWMSILIAGIISQIEILIIYFLAKRYPDQPIQQYVKSIIGRPLGFILNLFIALYCAQSSFMVAVSYVDVLTRWVLFETPWFILILLSFVIGAYIASSSLRSISTITQTIMAMFLLCTAIILTSGFGKGDWRHFFPIGSHGIGAILKDTIPAFWAYAGFELLLYVFPFVKSKKKKDILIAMSIANGFTTLFYLFISVIVLYNFSESQLNFIPEPMVFILRKFRWPIVQSLDILFMAIWFSVTTVTVYVYLFLSARYLAFLGKKEIQKHSLFVWIVALLCALVGIFFSDMETIKKFAKYHNALTLIIIITIPTLLLFISIVREKVARK
ncbi:GerAB/ArcD/ProY family transporter [Gottfriedia luciferensis]|uniref:GerAB/ArcD/ProY family transporter n=1 Tax=Gottfriedia luciferensis TaxID=178774 RepID=UPI000B432762|nr:GerAB/ArcD/ProY family transporter [Gottfriedia luciferensis]